MLFTSEATSGSWVRWRSASANSPIACSGWRRSWLAAAKNCVFARLAGSAARRACSDTPISVRSWAARSSLCAFRRITWSSALRCTRPMTSSAMNCSTRMPASCQCQGWRSSLAMRDRRHHQQAHEGNVQPLLRGQQLHRGQAEAEDHQHQRGAVIGRAQLPEQPHRHRPARGLRQHQHQHLPAAPPLVQRGVVRVGVAAEAQVMRQTQRQQRRQHAAPGQHRAARRQRPVHRHHQAPADQLADQRRRRLHQQCTNMVGAALRRCCGVDESLLRGRGIDAPPARRPPAASTAP
jgi:hypothetical protein